MTAFPPFAVLCFNDFICVQEDEDSDPSAPSQPAPVEQALLETRVSSANEMTAQENTNGSVLKPDTAVAIDSKKKMTKTASTDQKKQLEEAKRKKIADAAEVKARNAQLVQASRMRNNKGKVSFHFR